MAAFSSVAFSTGGFSPLAFDFGNIAPPAQEENYSRLRRIRHPRPPERDLEAELSAQFHKAIHDALLPPETPQVVAPAQLQKRNYEIEILLLSF